MRCCAGIDRRNGVIESDVRTKCVCERKLAAEETGMLECFNVLEKNEGASEGTMMGTIHGQFTWNPTDFRWQISGIPVR